MNTIIVVSDLRDWTLGDDIARVVAADEYLTSTEFAEQPRIRVINLCRSHRYQSAGYYVSLLAEARGHRPLADIATIQDLKSTSILKVVAVELEDLINRSLQSIQTDEFQLSVYFGHNVAKRHERLSGALFRMFPAPLLRATFLRSARSRRFALSQLSLLSLQEVMETHPDFFEETAREYLSARSTQTRRKKNTRFDLAILRDPSDPEPASDERAIKRFVKAGESIGFSVEVIGKDDYARISQFDALFIRDTTSVNHYTFRFARKAEAEGLVVIDDPDSILKCMNKVYLAELCKKHRIPTPRTMIVHKGNLDQVERELGLPCVLKQPDSAFSQGVTKVETAADLEDTLKKLLERSSLVIAQEFRPTEYDWRIGVLDGQPLYACRYFMAGKHWQIIKRDEKSGQKSEGRFDTIPVEQAPTQVVKIAVKAASLYGDGLFGVDLKQDGKDVWVIEVNDNPSIDGGIEDQILKDELYLRIVRHMMGRVEQRKRGIHS